MKVMRVAPIIEARSLSKHFLKDEQHIVALQSCNVAIEEGTFVTILGRSGCGKSTLLNLFAGLTSPTEGEILYRGQVMEGSPRLEVGYLTQSDTLMPWRTLIKNTEMPLEIRKFDRDLRAIKAQQLIDMAGLHGYEQHYPRELSGGMRRRASLARMLITEPETLLLDEPFGALDAQLRGEMQQELLRLWQGSGRTVVFVTHDIEEALTLADRVLVFGRLGRVDLDIEVPIERPRNVETIRLDPIFVELHRRLLGALKGDRYELKEFN